jgi:DNA segregation ATPase FtsK/SpoIIIE, S-DNA-T family
MAKRRTKQVRFQYELNGILLVLIAIIGLGRYGIVGRLLSSIAIFLVGYLHQVLLIVLAVIGLYMIFKSNKPKFLNSKLLSIYAVVIGILVLLTIGYVIKDESLTYNLFDHAFLGFKLSMDNFMKARGGGVIGASVATLFIKLFDVGGTRILMWVIIAGGFILFTGISFIDIIKELIFKFKWNFKLGKKKEEIKQVEEAYEKDNRVVVSSVDELIRQNDDKNINKDEHKEQMTIENFNVRGYSYPPITLLRPQIKKDSKGNSDEIKENVATLEQVFRDFEIEGKVVAINVGPSVTQYEMELKSGTKVNRVLGIHKEIALALAAKDVRIQAPIPGKRSIGVEIPNRVNTMVTVREILETIPKSYDNSKLLVTLGKNIMGKPIFTEINNTPHLLVAGATGSGKSVCINSMIISILMRTRPDEVKLILVDPKKVELSGYNGVPHLLAPVVTDPRKANVVLKKIVSEMERRYEIFSECEAKNIAGYNMYVEKKNKALPESEHLRKFPYIVVIIDELADLMLVAAKEVEDSIMRITQMARAAGIHLIVATQRPSTDVITGLIKANIPSRISFAVSSSIDSRTILDMTGAEKLLGKGDMLFKPMGDDTPLRVQGTYISEEEIKAVVDFTIAQQKARYDETLLMDETEMTSTTTMNSHDADDEPLYNEIVEFVLTQGKASASLLQRRFRLGYNRAARVIDLLEERGIIGPNNGSKPREVLVKLEEKDQ